MKFRFAGMKVLSLPIYMLTVKLRGKSKKETDDKLPYVDYLEDVGSIYVRTVHYSKVRGGWLVESTTVFSNN